MGWFPIQIIKKILTVSFHAEIRQSTSTSQAAACNSPRASASSGDVAEMGPTLPCSKIHISFLKIKEKPVGALIETQDASTLSFFCEDLGAIHLGVSFILVEACLVRYSSLYQRFKCLCISEAN